MPTGWSCWPVKIVKRGPSRLAISGELDIAGAPALAAELAACEGDIEVDCSGLTFVDARGLGVLIQARAACEARGEKLILVNPARCLERLLSVTGLARTFLTDAEVPGS